MDHIQPREVMKRLRLQSGKGSDYQSSATPSLLLNRSTGTRLPFSEGDIVEMRRPSNIKFSSKNKSRSTSVEDRNSKLNKTGSTKNTGRSRDRLKKIKAK